MEVDTKPHRCGQLTLRKASSHFSKLCMIYSACVQHKHVQVKAKERGLMKAPQSLLR